MNQHQVPSKYSAISDPFELPVNSMCWQQERSEGRKRGLVAKRLLIEKKPRLIAAAVAGGVALGFMAIGEVLVAMRDGFSGEGNTNGATLSSGGHIGIGGKHMGGLSTVVHWGVYHSKPTPHICQFLYANVILK